MTEKDLMAEMLGLYDGFEHKPQNSVSGAEKAVLDDDDVILTETADVDDFAQGFFDSLDNTEPDTPSYDTPTQPQERAVGSNNTAPVGNPVNTVETPENGYTNVSEGVTDSESGTGVSKSAETVFLEGIGNVVVPIDPAESDGESENGEDAEFAKVRSKLEKQAQKDWSQKNALRESAILSGDPNALAYYASTRGALILDDGRVVDVRGFKDSVEKNAENLPETVKSVEEVEQGEKINLYESMREYDETALNLAEQLISKYDNKETPSIGSRVTAELLLGNAENMGYPRLGKTFIKENDGEMDKTRLFEPNLKMNAKELEFFENLGIRSDNEIDRVARELKSPMGIVELPQDKKKRETLIKQGLFGRIDEMSFKQSRTMRDSDTSGKQNLHVRDMDFLRFLAKFKYATASHLKHLHCTTEDTALRRLKGLRGLGLVDSVGVLGPRPVWYLTRLGMSVSGFDYQVLNPKNISVNNGQLSHQFIVNYVASNIFGADIPVLGAEIGAKNRTDWLGRPVRGDEVLSEMEISSSFSLATAGKTAEYYKPQLIQVLKDEFRKWAEMMKENPETPSPELIPGNEWMWVVQPEHLSKNYHQPDLVVPRARNSSGGTESLAVEIELTKKAGGYGAILQSYQQYTHIYKKVIWVTNSRSIATAIMEAGEPLGMLANGTLEVLPVITENGAYTGRDLWQI